MNPIELQNAFYDDSLNETGSMRFEFRTIDTGQTYELNLSYDDIILFLGPAVDKAREMSGFTTTNIDGTMTAEDFVRLALREQDPSEDLVSAVAEKVRATLPPAEQVAMPDGKIEDVTATATEGDADGSNQTAPDSTETESDSDVGADATDDAERDTSND